MVYADVTIDGVMPVKVSLNRKNEVIRIEAVSKAGEDLADDMKENDLKGKSIEQAVGYAVRYIEEAHSEDADGQRTIITVECRNETKKNRMEKSLNKKYGGAAESGKEKDSGTEPAYNDAGTDESGKKTNNHPAEKETPERGTDAGTNSTKVPNPPDNGGGQNNSPHEAPLEQ